MPIQSTVYIQKRGRVRNLTQQPGIVRIRQRHESVIFFCSQCQFSFDTFQLVAFDCGHMALGQPVYLQEFLIGGLEDVFRGFKPVYQAFAKKIADTRDTF